MYEDLFAFAKDLNSKKILKNFLYFKNIAIDDL